MTEEIAETEEIVGRQTDFASRCDKCGNAAYVKVVLNNGPLFFCGHDFHVNESALREQAIEIFDEREFISLR